MGRGRQNPKAIKYARQKRARSYNASLASMFHGNPNGRDGHFVLDDGRIIRTKDVPDPQSKQRAAVLATAELWQSDFYQNVSEYCFIKIFNDFYPHGIKRFFSGEKHFFLLETEEVIYRSIVYSTKSIAMLACNRGRITFVECTPRKAPVCKP